jgi:enamine deaminase RidA (YjgF/YER057c/UK114 family)
VKLPICIVLLAGLIGTGTSAAQTKSRFITPASLPPSHGYSHIVEVPAGSRMVYISGQLPLDRKGKLVGAGDFRRQAEQVFANLQLALSELGGTFAHVVKLNYYLTDVSQLADLRAVRDQHVNRVAPPASSVVEVRRLLRDDVLLEIEAVAALPAP